MEDIPTIKKLRNNLRNNPQNIETIKQNYKNILNDIPEANKLNKLYFDEYIKFLHNLKIIIQAPEYDYKKIYIEIQQKTFDALAENMNSSLNMNKFILLKKQLMKINKFTNDTNIIQAKFNEIVGKIYDKYIVQERVRIIDMIQRLKEQLDILYQQIDILKKLKNLSNNKDNSLINSTSDFIEDIKWQLSSFIKLLQKNVSSKDNVTFQKELNQNIFNIESISYSKSLILRKIYDQEKYISKILKNNIEHNPKLFKELPSNNNEYDKLFKELEETIISNNKNLEEKLLQSQLNKTQTLNTFENNSNENNEQYQTSSIAVQNNPKLSEENFLSEFKSMENTLLAISSKSVPQNSNQKVSLPVKVPSIPQNSNQKVSLPVKVPSIPQFGLYINNKGIKYYNGRELKFLRYNNNKTIRYVTVDRPLQHYTFNIKMTKLDTPKLIINNKYKRKHYNQKPTSIS